MTKETPVCKIETSEFDKKVFKKLCADTKYAEFSDKLEAISLKKSALDKERDKIDKERDEISRCIHAIDDEYATLDYKRFEYASKIKPRIIAEVEAEEKQ